MKKHFIKYLAAIVFVNLICFATNASAWGPERPTFTMESPATYPVFNSITNNPTIGDERDFVRVGEIRSDVTSLKNEVEIIPGKQYLVYIYFHNNASATYNDAAHNRAGVAVRTRMSTFFPTVLTAGEKGKVSATITADNSNPTSVWDEAYFTTKTSKVLLSYVSGSAKIYNDWEANGSIMPSTLFTSEGTLIGLNALNGVIPGCEEYHGVVSYVVEAKELSGSIEKTASKTTIAPGEEVEFKLTIKNTGDVKLTNVVVRDSLPEGLTLVPGSVHLSANNSTTSDQLSDNLTATGYNLGSIGTGNTVYITYRAKAGDDFDCAGSSVTNTATLTYDSDQSSGDSRTASSTITIKKTDGCDEPEPEPGKPHGVIKKTASKTTATPGDEIEFKIIIKNTSDVKLTNVVVKDALPTGLTFVSDSAKLSSEDSTTVTDISDEIVTTGYNIGNIDSGKTITITYRVKVDDGFDCTGSSVTNTASLTYDGNQSSEHTASSEVMVKKVDGCSEEERPTEIVQTGPLEITMATIIAIAIIGTGGYYWYTHRTLKTVKDKVAGKTPKDSKTQGPSSQKH